MKMSLSIYDISIIFAYLMVMICIGVWFFSKNKHVADVMDGGRSFSAWPLGASIFSSWMSNLAIISLPAVVYAKNWSYFIMFLGIPVSGILVMKYMVPLYRGEGSISAYSYIERRFGNWAALFCGGCYIITNITRLALIIYLVAVSVGYLTGYEERWVLLLIGGTVVLYSVMGGLGCIIWTDFIQAFLMVVGVFVILWSLWINLSMDFSEVLSVAKMAGKFNMGSMDVSLLKPTMWLLVLHSLVTNFQGLGTEQGFVQRYMAAKDDTIAKKSVLIGAIATLIFAGLLFIIGTLLYVYYNKEGMGLGYNIDTEYVLMRFVSEHIPHGMKGLILVSIMAASMSSVDTEINAIATIFHKHVYEKIVKPTVSAERSLNAFYKTSVIVGSTSIFLAYGMTVKSNFLDMWDNFDSFFSGGILGLFLLAMIVKGAGRAAAIVGLALGGFLVLWLAFSPGWESPLLVGVKNPMHSYLNIVIAALVMVFAGYGATKLFNYIRK